MNQIDHYQKEKTKQVTELMKNELGRKIVTKFLELREKYHSYLKMTIVRVKKQKVQESVS